MRLLLAVVMASVLIMPAWGASPDEDPGTRRIVVVGHGTGRASPDVATLSFTLRGEGHEADEATRSLVAMRSAADKALASLGVTQDAVHTGVLSIAQVRDKACHEDNDYDPEPRLSVGACAVTGYVATLGVTVRMRPDQAGTAGGLMGRIGASDVRVAGFELSDDRPARDKAVAAALEDARMQAEAIARGAGERLGPLLTVRNPNALNRSEADIIVTATRAPAAPPPVIIPLSPEPVERTADLIVTYAIQP